MANETGGATSDAIITALKGSPVASHISGCLTLTGAAQAIVAVATPCIGVLLRAPAATEPTDAGPNAAAFFAGPVTYPTAIRVALTQTEGLYLAIKDAALIRVIGTASDKVKYTIFAL
jgi:ribosomal protein L11